MKKKKEKKCSDNLPHSQIACQPGFNRLNIGAFFNPATRLVYDVDGNVIGHGEMYDGILKIVPIE